MTINSETLRAYRESKNLSQADLARNSGVSKKTISRIELGEVSRPNLATKDRLAKALEVGVSDLAKPAGERDAIERRLKKAGYRKLNGHIDSETAVAYAMVQYRYGISPQSLIEMAPLFFTLLAEGSLAWRKRKADELQTAIKVLGAISSDARHLIFASATNRADDALLYEHKSITERDIFGKEISEEAVTFGFDARLNNPFVDYLHSLCIDIDDSALEIDPYALGNCKVDDCMPHYVIAPADLESITGGDIRAEFAIERGYAKISKIPSDLLEAETKAERVAWIVSQIPSEARIEYQDYLDSLPDLDTLDIEKWGKKQ